MTASNNSANSAQRDADVLDETDRRTVSSQASVAATPVAPRSLRDVVSGGDADFPEPSLLIEAGQVIASRFKIIKKLGEGGMGLVFQAHDPKLKRHVVLKFIKRELAAHEHMVERLLEEAAAAAALDHQHIVKIYDRDRDAFGDFLVMQHINGPHLLELLAQEGGKLPIERAVRYAQQVGSALQRAHEANILHRDVKPSNILIDEQDNAILADWGLARILDEAGQTRSGAVIGTLDYMAPEVLKKASNASAQSDLYSLAATLYQLLTGRSPKMMRESLIPEALRRSMLEALEDDPALRPASVNQFLSDLPIQAISAGLAPALPSSSIGLAPMESRLMATGAGSAATEDVAMRQGTIGTRPMGIESSAPEPDLAKIFAQMQAKSENIKTAAEASLAEHNYAQAVSLLEQIPEGLRTEVAGMLSDAKTKRDRVQALNQTIREATPKMQVDVLRPSVEALLQLQPQLEGMQRLQAQIAKLTPKVIPAPLAPAGRGAGDEGLGRSGGKAGERKTFELGEIEYAFRWCPAGKFMMGSPASEVGRFDDEVQVPVELTKGFWLQETQVTQGMWESVMGTQPWMGKSNVKEGSKIAASYVNWNDAQRFCVKLQASALKAGVMTASQKLVLPSEARWEYGCRAGTTTGYYFGNDAKKLDEYAWYERNAWKNGERYAHAVGLKNANDWGLLDLHGNVWEWCEDYYQKELPGGLDPVVTAGSCRVLRGGSVSRAPFFVRSASRSFYDPTYRLYRFGFRVVIEP